MLLLLVATFLDISEGCLIIGARTLLQCPHATEKLTVAMYYLCYHSNCKQRKLHFEIQKTHDFM